MAGSFNMAKIRGDGEGFTLLEVLVAMVIVGTAVASLLSLLSGSMSNLRRAESASEALLKARSKMNQLLLAEQPVVLLQSNGSLLPGEGMSGQWDDLTRWEASVQPLPQPANALPAVPVRVVLNVWWRRSTGSAERQFQLETIQIRSRPVAGAGS